ncbi:hypothetical protein Cni_G16098 [Canna indica]|uniref:Uncharacterized protein n=1 Tax=Canna indica TaxID=4628 RepID=A0AAQ3KI41_9LILI|nr:hypothetical protein Cni_G16098 [Canna indica]
MFSSFEAVAESSLDWSDISSCKVHVRVRALHLIPRFSSVMRIHAASRSKLESRGNNGWREQFLGLNPPSRTMGVRAIRDPTQALKWIHQRSTRRQKEADPTNFRSAQAGRVPPHRD